MASESASIGSGRVKVKEVNNLIRGKATAEDKTQTNWGGRGVNRVETAKFKAVRSLICGRLDR